MPFFIEVGVCDFDTCHKLIENGWRGMMVEPVRYYFDRLPRHANVILENVAVSDSNGETNIHFIDPSKIADGEENQWLRGVSSVDGGGCFRYNPNVPIFKDCLVDRVMKCTLNDLCEKHNVKVVDFLKIDTEGHDLNVLRSIDLDSIDVRVIKIEHKHTGKEEIVQLLEAKNYIVYVESEDIYAIK